MARFFGGAKERVMGLDIGTYYIKAAQVESDKTGWHLRGIGFVPTPPNSIREGVVVDKAALAEAIREVVKKANIHANAAVTSASGPTVVTRHVDLPAMRPEQLRGSLPFQIRDKGTVPFPVEEAVMEGQIVSKPEELGEPTMKVLVVAAHRELVNSRVEAIEMAGLDPIVMELEPFALKRAFVEISKDTQVRNQTVALLDLGASSSEMSIIKGDEFVLAQSIPFGGDSITKQVSSALKLSLKEADEFKKTLSIALSQEEFSALTPEAQTANQTMVPLLDDLIRHARRVINFFQAQLPEGTEGTAIDKIILCGGTAKLGRVDRFLAQRLEIPVEIGNVFESTGLDTSGLDGRELGEIAQFFAVSVGLAVRQIVLGPGAI